MKKIIKSLFVILIVVSAIDGQHIFAADYDLNTYVYNHLENWDTEFEIPYYKSDVIDVIKEIAKNDDYLMRSIEELVYYKNGDVATLTVTYRTTKGEEEYINKILKEKVNSLINPNMSDFEKIKAINNYIINTYEYDYTLKSNNAYTALTTGKTTCQGYAMTAYKMLNLAGIENRIVIGELNGIAHGWNLVKLNNKWYQLDITNNDALSSDKYFLKSDDYLKKNGFTWESTDYPKSDNNYDFYAENILTNGQPFIGYKSNIDGNWYLKNNSWYFIKNSGVYVTGWNIIDNNWYCLGSNGAMKTGWIYYNGKWYYCYPFLGSMAVNTVINGYKVNFNGEWIS